MEPISTMNSSTELSGTGAPACQARIKSRRSLQMD